MNRGSVGLAGTWLAAGIDLLFPPSCVLCRRDIVRGSPAESAGARRAAGGGGGPAVAEGPGADICGVCVADLVDGVSRCPWCGAETRASGCRACPGRTRDHDGIVVLGGYRDGLREAVLRAKRPAGRPVAAALGRLLHERHGDTIRAWQPDAIVPVPMHWWRRVVRGTSSADVIAAGLASASRIPLRRVLRRRRSTVMQNRLPAERRRGNVLDAFAVSRGGVAGRRVLLVDDVATTGGTIAACRRALAGAGAIAVHVAVIARADHGGDDGATPRE